MLTCRKHGESPHNEIAGAILVVAGERERERDRERVREGRRCRQVSQVSQVIAGETIQGTHSPGDRAPYSHIIGGQLDLFLVPT